MFIAAPSAHTITLREEHRLRNIMGLAREEVRATAGWRNFIARSFVVCIYRQILLG
jgi:hypothetical protein